MGLLLTFITGVLFLVGIILNKILKNKKEIEVLSVSLAFCVILNLIVFDIFPEVLENFSYLSLIYIVLGFLILKIMDILVPHHHHDHKEVHDDKMEHNNHLMHINIISILALSFHNILECMALYKVSLNDLKAGILMCIGIGMHNIPLGFSIGDKLGKHKILYVVVLVLSGLLGGFIAFSFNDIPHMIEHIILCITLGMLIYLCFFELFVESIHNYKNKYCYLGILIGIIFVIITNIL